MPIQSQPQIADNRFVVTAINPWSGDPTKQIVTMQALVPITNTQGSAIGQAYDLSNTTLNSNAVSGGVTIPGGSFPVA